ncbi:MAG TPA: heavy metal translocating P-type ATPase [Acholeplasma sp.]|nr:heavy metal translocating P-type ATPase [Acholeplasma sp.]
MRRVIIMHKEQHSHIKIYINLYIIGLVLYLFSLLIDPLNIIKLSFNSNYILIPIYIIILILSGFHVIFEGIEDTIKKTIKKRRFSPNVHILMLLAAIGAIIINHYHEAIILILIFAGAHFLEDLVQSKSKKEIEKLLNLNPPNARLIKPNGEIIIIDSKDLKVGDEVVVLNGDQIPSDGIIIEGETEINESTITGESMPVLKGINDQVFSSTINNSNKIIVRINKSSDETVVAKIIQLVNETQTDLSETAKLINKIEPVYVTIALIFAPIFYLLGAYVFNWDNAFYRTMVFLIGASPCALAVTDIPATLSAISNLAKRGILFKGGSYVSNFYKVDTIAFDKTGTLTNGTPTVTDILYLDINNEYKDIIYTMEKGSNHPLAKAIIEKFDRSIDLNFEVINLIGVGIKANYNGNEYLIGKPSSFVINDEELITKTETLEKDGKTVVYFSENNKIKVIITFIDDIKETSIEAVNYFNQEAIKTVMITGDSSSTANAIAKKVNVNTVYSNVLPHEKSEIIDELKQNDQNVIMVGDGINDAPALAIANIGVAMNSGTDLAVEVADAVLMRNNLNDLTYTYKVSKKLKNIVLQNIIFAMSIVVFLIIMNIFGIMHMPLAVVFHEGSTLVVVFSGLRMLRKV